MLIFLMSIIEEEPKKTKFELLYHKYVNLMFYIVGRLYDNQHNCEDIVQEAFVRLIRCQDQIDEIDSAHTKRLVVVITKQAVVDFWRKEKKEAGHASLNAFMEEGRDIEPKAAPEENSMKNSVMDAIKQLPEQYRTIFLLKYDKGYQNKEIANMLSLTEFTIRKRLSRGKKELERYLTDTNTNVRRG